MEKRLSAEKDHLKWAELLTNRKLSLLSILQDQLLAIDHAQCIK